MVGVHQAGSEAVCGTSGVLSKEGRPRGRLAVARSRPVPQIALGAVSRGDHVLLDRGERGRKRRELGVLGRWEILQPALAASENSIHQRSARAVDTATSAQHGRCMLRAKRWVEPSQGALQGEGESKRNCVASSNGLQDGGSDRGGSRSELRGERRERASARRGRSASGERAEHNELARSVSLSYDST
jgi:hypothetical protein